MKSFIITAFIACLLFSCAHKITKSAEPVVVNTVKPPAETPREVVTKMESPEAMAGKDIYMTKCSRCHGPKKVDDWTVQEWIPIMDRMAPKARLDATEKNNVTAYVNFHAKSGS